jgi:hypothetical protein
VLSSISVVLITSHDNRGVPAHLSFTSSQPRSGSTPSFALAVHGIGDAVSYWRAADVTNGYCTHIGNERFAWFASTGSKSRINFLELLRAGHDAYTLNEAALAYMAEHKLPGAQLQALTSLAPAAWTGQAAWQALLDQQTITDPRHVRVVTEGALLGTVVAHGVAPDLAILSDDAGQFDVLIHALCWIHAERVLAKLLGFNAPQRAALASTRSELWAIYDALKAYKKAPDVLTAAAIEARFGKLCATRTGYASLDQALKRMRRNQAELLRVLQRPELPLHNNLSEC